MGTLRCSEVDADQVMGCLGTPSHFPRHSSCSNLEQEWITRWKGTVDSAGILSRLTRTSTTRGHLWCLMDTDRQFVRQARRKAVLCYTREVRDARGPPEYNHDPTDSGFSSTGYGTRGASKDMLWISDKTRVSERFFEPKRYCTQFSLQPPYKRIWIGAIV